MKGDSLIRRIFTLLVAVMLIAAAATVRSHHHVDGTDSVCVCLSPSDHCHCSGEHHHQSQDSEHCALDLTFYAISTHHHHHGGNCHCALCGHTLAFAITPYGREAGHIETSTEFIFSPYLLLSYTRPAYPGPLLRAPPCI